jgi:hypothetical protein
MVEPWERGKAMLEDSGEQTRIRTVAASSMLRQHHSVRLRLTERGFELTSEGASEPVICESWPRAKRVLQRLGVSDRKMNEISMQLSEASEVIVRARA